MKEKPRILIVDDQPINVKLLQRKLERENMEVIAAYGGMEALELVKKHDPNLILLDVMMPEMDGLEVCRRIKESEDTQSIPIIFITAKSTKEGKLEGLGVGAADYITKPIDLEETLARVHTQLNIQSIYRQNLELTERLGEARQAAAIGAITQGIAHNLNNLLGVVVGYLDLIKSGFDSPDMVRRSTLLMDQAIQRMVNIVRQLSTVATDEEVPVSDISLDKLMGNAVERFQQEFDLPNANIEIINQADGKTFRSNPEVMETVLCRLLINAWESYPTDTDPADCKVTLEARSTLRHGRDYIQFIILDEGSGIDPEVEDHMFDPFITSKTSVGRGMGLTIARHGIRSLQGSLEVKNRESGGVEAIVSHPL